MAEEKAQSVAHVEKLQHQHVLTSTLASDRSSKAKETTVQSVALADALAKDNPATWSVSMMKLYAIMALITLSMSVPSPSRSSRVGFLTTPAL